MDTYNFKKAIPSIIKRLDSEKSVNLEKCSRSLAYRCAKDINDTLIRENYDWRVTVEYNEKEKTGIIEKIR